MEQSYIETHGNGGASFVGTDAVSLFAAITLASALRMYARSGLRASRFHTPTNMLAAASKITQKKYKRGEFLKAADDVTAWCDTMRAALPIIHK